MSYQLCPENNYVNNPFCYHTHVVNIILKKIVIIWFEVTSSVILQQLLLNNWICYK